MCKCAIPKVIKMEEYSIEIEYEDHDKFKEGMHDIRQQIWHIDSQIKELNGYRDRLEKMRKEAINYYCDPDNEYSSSKIWIPMRIAKTR